MMVVVRGMDYDDVLDSLKGRKVALWTCNTCARLCGVGGSDALCRLADRLEADGIEVRDGRVDLTKFGMKLQ